MDGQCASLFDELPAGFQRVGIPVATDHEVGAIGTNALGLCRRGDVRHENGRGHAETHGCVGNRRPMIAAGRRDDARLGHGSEREIRERAAHLE